MKINLEHQSQVFKEEFAHIADDYYSKVGECKTPAEVFRLNWKATERMLHLQCRAFKLTFEDVAQQEDEEA